MGKWLSSLLCLVIIIAFISCTEKPREGKPVNEEYPSINLKDSISSIEDLVEEGNKYFAAHRLDIAEDLYKEALAKNNDLPQVHFNLGLIYDRTYRFERAKREYSIAINQKKGYLKAHMNLGLVLAKMNDYEGGLEHIEWVLQEDPGNVPGLYNRALILHKSHSPEATEAWKAYIDEARGRPDQIGNVNRAIVYLKMLESTRE